MKYILLYFLTLSFIFSKTEATPIKSDKTYISYTQNEFFHHKQKFIQEITKNALYCKDPHYQMKRAISTISAIDSDYIPKVAGAGDIFNENDSVSYQLMHNGVKIVVNSYYDSQWLTDVIYGLKGHHEPQEEKCFYEVLKDIPEDATMIELGSYWGYYSLWFADEIKNSTNYLIEPDPKRLEVGKRNFELNNKTANFYRGFVGVPRDNEPDLNGADYISIDDFMDKNQIEHLNILHADIQGAEYEMLLSTVNHLDRIDYFFISTHQYEADHLPCLSFFQHHDFVILAEHSCYESCSGDGLIVAKRKGVKGPDKIDIQKYKQPL